MLCVFIYVCIYVIMYVYISLFIYKYVVYEWLDDRYFDIET
jgi:hypothetical protein